MRGNDQQSGPLFSHLSPEQGSRQTIRCARCCCKRSTPIAASGCGLSGWTTTCGFAGSSAWRWTMRSGPPTTFTKNRERLIAQTPSQVDGRSSTRGDTTSRWRSPR